MLEPSHTSSTSQFHLSSELVPSNLCNRSLETRNVHGTRRKGEKNMIESRRRIARLNGPLPRLCIEGTSFSRNGKGAEITRVSTSERNNLKHIVYVRVSCSIRDYTGNPGILITIVLFGFRTWTSDPEYNREFRGKNV